MLKVTDEEKKAIRKQHENATKKHFNRKDELKQGLQKPEEKKEDKPKEDN